ncbi:MULTISPECIES: putative 2OG-Fe(II) oxygenase [Marisediminitalea]|uniref:putative 2OG-Fe(II) oxygenase n=1 Tax=Marisediminitalea TaxID=2662254 RepID=UPI000C3D5553|nr:putative 2OG-Fe(II) oxygenase [Marisediminitalea aggregata]MBL52609.1 hypothetical protein [Alteromonadaceae bacterium]MCP9478006.1 putative 2OG-Fe(II) oxygenase [Marisediminitalea aggregata]
MNQQLFQSLYQQKQYGQLITAFESPQNNLKTDALVNSLYLNALRHRGYTDKAQKGYERLYKKMSHLPFVVNGFGNLLIATNQFERAVEVYKKGIVQIGPQFEFYFNAGRALQRASQYVTAQQYFTQSLQLNPNAFEARVCIAECVASRGLLQQSYEIVAQLLPHAPQHPRLLQHVSMVCRRLHKYEEAINLDKRRTQLYPQDMAAWRNLGGSLALAGHAEDALQAYTRALALAGTNSEVHIELANWLWFNGDADPFRYFKQAIQAQPDNQAFWLAFIHLLIKCDDWERASDEINQLQTHHATTPEILLLQSTIERESGNASHALLCTERAMAMQPKPQTAALINEHTYNLLATEHYPQALKFAQVLIRREPKDQGWWNLYVTCLRKLNKSKEYHSLCDYQKLVSITDWQADSNTVNTLMAYLQASHSGKRQPIGQSLQSGTQTLEELFDIPDAPIVNLKAHILDMIAAHVNTLPQQSGHPLLSRIPKSDEYFFTGSWSVRLRQNGYHKPHFHPAGWLSGVIYLGVPDAVNKDGQGWIEFGRPNITGLHDEPEFVVKPQVGRLILFPSYLWHGTRAFASDETRLTVAFDLIPASERQ